MSADSNGGTRLEQQGYCERCGHAIDYHGANGCDVEVRDYGEMDCRCARLEGPSPAGRFVLLHVGFEAGMEQPEESYVTSWDTWQEARVAFSPKRAVMRPGFKLIDCDTGRVWHPGARYVWEDAQT